MPTYNPNQFRGLLGQAMSYAPGAQNSPFASSSGWNQSHADATHGLPPGTTANWLRQQNVLEAMSSARMQASQYANPYLRMIAGMQFGPAAFGG